MHLYVNQSSMDMLESESTSEGVSEVLTVSITKFVSEVLLLSMSVSESELTKISLSESVFEVCFRHGHGL